MAKLSKNNTYAILWLNSTGLSALDISNELDLNLKQVNDLLEKNNSTNTSNNIKTTQQSVSVNNKNLMITETMSKKNNTVAIMTQQASSANDEVTKKMSPSNSRKVTESIFRPKNK